jgi:glucose/arabinose dehydrogenase/cytochrome c553
MLSNQKNMRKNFLPIVAIILLVFLGLVIYKKRNVKPRVGQKIASNYHLESVYFESMDLGSEANGRYTSLVIGPDGKLYAAMMDGKIKRFLIQPNGAIKLEHTFKPFGDTEKILIGLTFEPKSDPQNLTVWITYSDTPGLKNGPEWDGRIARFKFHSSEARLENFQLVITNLPRSAKDHLTNSLTFAQDGAIYFSQGSNTGMGRATDERSWALREEHLLSGAILKLDVNKLPKKLPLDVKTPDGGGIYNPYAADAPLSIFSTGLRNAYDIVSHSNGRLYTAVNGSAGGKNSPTSDPNHPLYIAPSPLLNRKPVRSQIVPAVTKIRAAQHDRLLLLEEGKYYGHPNPLRAEYALHRGSKDVAEKEYKNIKPEAHFKEAIFDFGLHASPNGMIEYKANAFAGKLNNILMVARFNTYNDILLMELDKSGSKIQRTFDGEAIGLGELNAPLDLVSDTKTGNIYVSEFGGNEGRIVLFVPSTPDRMPTESPNLAKKASYQEQTSITEANTQITLCTTPKELELGKQIFASNCSACHGEDADGGAGPSLIDTEWLYGGDFASIFQSVRYGRKNGMQAWKEKLNQEQIRQVASYVVKLGKESFD